MKKSLSITSFELFICAVRGDSFLEEEREKIIRQNLEEWAERGQEIVADIVREVSQMNDTELLSIYEC
jgi:hypothetical protein